MPTCLKAAKLDTGIDRVYSFDPVIGLKPPFTEAVVYVPDSAGSDISGCAAVSISGAEYQAIQMALTQQGPSAGAGGGAAVSGDVFMGAALVAVLAIGWIAGAQR